MKKRISGPNTLRPRPAWQRPVPTCSVILVVLLRRLSARCAALPSPASYGALRLRRYYAAGPLRPLRAGIWRAAVRVRPRQATSGRFAVSERLASDCSPPANPSAPPPSYHSVDYLWLKSWLRHCLRQITDSRVLTQCHGDSEMRFSKEDLAGPAFMAFGITLFVGFFYAAIVSKLLPPYENQLLAAIQNDWYYCLLVPLTLPVIIVAVYLHWLSMKMFKHA